MTERRSLAEGIKKPEIDRTVEDEFVFQAKSSPSPTKPAAANSEEPRKAAPSLLPPRRSPLTSKIRTEFVEALKRASLERQLAGIRPHQLQEILEEAIEPWLKQHGYLP